MTLAEELKIERGQPISLELAARFLPLIARESPSEFDAWALRWLARWASESAGSIEQAAEVAAALADLPSEPTAFERLRQP
jgi:hypothetical protein